MSDVPTSRTPRTRRWPSILTAGAIVVATVSVAASSPVDAIEVGPDDFRISSMGPDLTAGFEAHHPKVAFDADTERYLVVWQGDDQGDGQSEIYGQLVDAATGALVGPDGFLIARIGAVGDTSTNAIEPAVAWNSSRGEFVVVFAGDDTSTTPPAVATTYEIYAQRVSTDGAVTGSRLRVSSMGASDADTAFDAYAPDVAYDEREDRFLVVWQGDDDAGSLVDGEFEIHGRLLGYDGGGALIAVDDQVRLSTMGSDGDVAGEARDPAVTHDPTTGRYLVVWSGDDTGSGTFRIHGQFVDADGVEVGTDDVVIGALGDEAYSPDVAVDPDSGTALVVWQGDDVPGEFEIRAQRIDTATGGLVGSAFTISDAGPSGSTAWLAGPPAAGWDATEGDFVVVWAGDDSNLGTVDDEYEVFAARVGLDGSTPDGPVRISAMGPDGAANTTVGSPDVATSSLGVRATAVVWSAENPPLTAAGESEIWGQFIAPTVELTISKTLTSAADPSPGDVVVYEITYENLGPSDATDVVITDTIPVGIEIDQVVSSQPELTRRDGTTFVWDLAVLPAGTGGTITLTGTLGLDATDGATITNAVEIATRSLRFDPDPTDDTATASLTVDAPPNVTVEQAIGQTDPTNASPILFTVTFSEPVTGFADDDVVLAGTASPTSAVVSGGPSVYTVAVSGMSGDGTVVASVPAGVAEDAAGKPNLDSTSTDNVVTYLGSDPNPGVNDPPIVTAPATRVVEVGDTVAFTGADAVTVVDPDALDADIEVTVAVTAGSVDVSLIDDLTSVTGRGTATLTLVGPQTAIRTSLAGLTFRADSVAAVTMTVTADDRGNTPGPPETGSATVAITVVDTVAPTIRVPESPIRAVNDPGSAGAVVTFDVSATDASAPSAPASLNLACSPASGTFFPLGTTTVTCTASDEAGNVATASFSVVVTDVEAPVIGSSPNITAVLPRGASTVPVSFTLPIATDNSGQVTVSCSPASGSAFGLGTTAVSCTAMDPSGNRATTTFSVVVSAAVPPSGGLPATGGQLGLLPTAMVALAGGLVLMLGSRRGRRSGV